MKKFAGLKAKTYSYLTGNNYEKAQKSVLYKYNLNLTIKIV